MFFLYFALRVSLEIAYLNKELESLLVEIFCVCLEKQKLEDKTNLKLAFPKFCKACTCI